MFATAVSLVLRVSPLAGEECSALAEPPEPPIAIHAPEGTQTDQRKRTLKAIAAMRHSDGRTLTLGTLHCDGDPLSQCWARGIRGASAPTRVPAVS